MSDYDEIEWLDKKKIEAFLSPLHRSQLAASLEIFTTIDSTNTYLLNKKELISPAVCIAEEQTKGRGRQGKDWYSPKGRNIYCSCLLTVPVSVTDFSQLSLALAVILMDALKRYGFQNNFQLKWPNDIYFAFRKLGGILIETHTTHNKVCAVVIGIGLNISLPNNHPLITPSIALQEMSEVKISRNKLVGLVIDEILKQVPYYFVHGFKPFLSKWRSRDLLQNKFVVVKQARYEIPGIAQGITDQGELILRDAQGKEQLIRNGDVSVVFT